MSFDQWILALHLLSAFAYVAGMIVFWVRSSRCAGRTRRMETSGWSRS
jgi:hypothetical protein